MFCRGAFKSEPGLLFLNFRALQRSLLLGFEISSCRLRLTVSLGMDNLFPRPSASIILPPTSAGQERSPGSEDDAPPPKRQRTALACNSCRSRKSRCNGKRPVCSMCSANDLQCVYRRQLTPPKRQPQALTSMQARLEKLEDLVQACFVAQPPNRHPGSSLTPNLSESVAGDSQGPGEVFTGGNEQWSEHALVHPHGTVVNELHETGEDTVDGLGMTIFADESTTGYFGPSSNSFFLNQIAKAMATSTKSSGDEEEMSRRLATSVSRPQSPPVPFVERRADMSNVFALPPHGELYRLVEMFFTFAGMFFPFLHKRRVLEIVELVEMGKNTTGLRKSWFCLLNAILALGVIYDRERSPAITTMETESDVAFQRAMTLLPWTGSDASSIEYCKCEYRHSLSDA